MMKWIVTVTIALTPNLFGQTVQRLSLEDAIKIGQGRNKTLPLSSAKADAASAKSNEAHTMLLPTLKFTGGYTRLSDVPPFQIQPPGSPVPITIVPTVLDNYNLRVSLQQPIFTGFKLRSNARSAEYFARAAGFDLQNDREDLNRNITAAYWMLYQALETKKVVDENAGRLQSYHKDTENLLKAGMATRNDLLKIEVQLSNAKLSQIDAANDVQIAAMNLNNVVGLPIETEIEQTSSPSETTMVNTSETAGALAQKALGSRSDVQALLSRVEASKASVDAAEGNYFPQIFLMGNYYYNRPNVRYQPTIDQFKSTWDVGIQVQFDIWNWGATASQVEQSRALLSQYQFLYEQMKDNVYVEVKTSYLAVQRAREKISVAKLGVDQAEENTRTTRDKYKTGFATSSELLDADVALLQAKTNYTGALVEAEIASARFKKSIGEQPQ